MGGRVAWASTGLEVVHVFLSYDTNLRSAVDANVKLRCKMREARFTAVGRSGRICEGKRTLAELDVCIPIDARQQGSTAKYRQQPHNKRGG